MMIHTIKILEWMNLKAVQRFDVLFGRRDFNVIL